MSKAHELLRESTVDAVTLLRDVINDADAPMNLRVQAADLVLSRTLPKNVAVHVGIDSLDPEPLFKRLLQNTISGIVPGRELDRYEGGTIDIDGEGDDDIIDAEIIEDDDVIEWER